MREDTTRIRSRVAFMVASCCLSQAVKRSIASGANGIMGMKRVRAVSLILVQLSLESRHALLETHVLNDQGADSHLQLVTFSPKSICGPQLSLLHVHGSLSGIEVSLSNVEALLSCISGRFQQETVLRVSCQPFFDHGQEPVNGHCHVIIRGLV